MERQRLIKIIDNKGTSSREETNELWDIVRTYPYFQTARLLLIKSFHNQASIHFHNELKVAAAYAPDRKVLFHLIHQSTEPKHPAETEANVFVLEQNHAVESYIDERPSENQFAISEEQHKEAPFFEINDESPAFNEKIEPIIPETKYVEEEEVQNEEIEKKKNIPEPATFALDEPATTNEEIIRRRLNEILSRSKPEEAPPAPQRGENASNEASVLNPPLASLEELPDQPRDVIEGLEIETIIEESYLSELEKLPEISHPAPRRGEDALKKASELNSIEEEKIDKPYSFIDWLKEKSGGHTTVEEVKDEPFSFDYNQDEIASPPSGDRGALIDKFIAASPRIVPTKAEFYSPSNMARLSITDNEDIISETLARIYFDQGNYPKARSCYVKLSLLYPEKNASFAPLIEKIDNILKEQT